LGRAYIQSNPPSGRTTPGGVDPAALYPAKRLFGAARNTEEGGSLTIVATALVDTNSRVDDAIFEELAGTANMELRLDGHLAAQRIYPAVDVAASSTQHEELLFSADQLPLVRKLRRELSGLAADGSNQAALALLTDRMQMSRTNDELLAAIGK